jgi:hypothetical protein
MSFIRIDLASDYDTTVNFYNKWLSPKDRALAVKQHQQKKESEMKQKQQRVVTIDLVNKKVVLEQHCVVPTESNSNHIDREDNVIKTDKEQETIHTLPRRIVRNPHVSEEAPKFIKDIFE